MNRAPAPATATPAPGHDEHVDACVVDAEGWGADGARLEISAVAGGQPDDAGHYSTIAIVARTLMWDGNGWVDTATKREVWAVIDADMMASLRGLR